MLETTDVFKVILLLRYFFEHGTVSKPQLVYILYLFVFLTFVWQTYIAKKRKKEREINKNKILKTIFEAKYSLETFVCL